MKTLIAFFLMTTSAYSQTVNNATVNIQGANQNVSVNQSGGFHTAIVDLRGNNIVFSGTQSGSTPQSYSVTIDCGNNCPANPFIINQY